MKRYAGSMDFLVRFWSHVAVGPEVECWSWIGHTRKGYGSARMRTDSRIAAHRVAFEITTGAEIPRGAMLCHSCDNPPCCNPVHLSIGTNSSNIRESVARGRHVNANKAVCGRGHPFTSENTRMYRRKGGTTERVCRACTRAYAHEHQRRRSAALARNRVP